MRHGSLRKRFTFRKGDCRAILGRYGSRTSRGRVAASGHDVLHLRDEGLQRLTDDKVFAKAGAENRIVITFDLDFGEIAAASRGRLPSVVLFRMRDNRSERVVSRLADVLGKSSDALVQGAIIVVEDERHRVPDFRLADRPLESRPWRAIHQGDSSCRRSHRTRWLFVSPR